MTILEIIMNILHNLFNKIYEIRDVIMGSLVYAMYSHVHLGKDMLKNTLEFFMGVIFAVYLTPSIHEHYPDVELSFLSFIMGLFGMKIVEYVLNANWTNIIHKIWIKK